MHVGCPTAQQPKTCHRGPQRMPTPAPEGVLRKAAHDGGVVQRSREQRGGRLVRGAGEHDLRGAPWVGESWEVPHRSIC